MQKKLFCCKVWLPYGNRQNREVQKFLILFPTIFKKVQTDCCGAQGQATASLFDSLQVDLITRSPVPETGFNDLNPFWSWRENFMLLNLIISIY